MPDANHEPFLLVDERLETPPYRQIAEQLRGAIESGSLAAGALLPTVRQLAGDLRIAPNTVARAYTDMQAEGWIVSDGRRGTRVAKAYKKRPSVSSVVCASAGLARPKLRAKLRV